MKHNDLKCEFCDGCGEFSRDNSDGVAVEGECSFCDGTGIDRDQLKKLFIETHSIQEPCSACGCSIQAHSEDMVCPSFFAGEFYGWLDSKFVVKAN